MADSTSTYEQDLAKTLESFVDPVVASTQTPPTAAPTVSLPDDAQDEPASSLPTPSVATDSSEPHFLETNSDATPEEPAVEETPAPVETPFVAAAVETPDSHSTSATVSGPLGDIKKDALVELRPLVEKLNISPEEKFDTYLLIIRSTDDSELIAPAHEAAKAISDDTRRAEALLEIIKEIDYLSSPKAAA